LSLDKEIIDKCWLHDEVVDEARILVGCFGEVSKVVLFAVAWLIFVASG